MFMNENLKKGLTDSILLLNRKLELFNKLDRRDLELITHLYGDGSAGSMSILSPVQATHELFKYRFSQPRQKGSTTMIREMAKLLKGSVTIITPSEAIAVECYRRTGLLTGYENISVMSSDRFVRPERGMPRIDPYGLDTIIISDEFLSYDRKYLELMDNINNYISTKGFPVLLLDFSR